VAVADGLGEVVAGPAAAEEVVLADLAVAAVAEAVPVVDGKLYL